MGTRSRILALGILLASGPAQALPAGIYATDAAVDTEAKGWEAGLKKQAKKAFAKGANDKWHFYFVAFLNKPAPGDDLHIVFYEANAKGKQEPTALPINTRAGARIVASEATVAPENGIKPGPFNVKVTYLANGKEIVLAATRLELK